MNRKRTDADKPPEQPMEAAMLAEIFMLRLEATARAAEEAATTRRFVPITLAAAKVPNPSGGLCFRPRARPLPRSPWRLPGDNS